MSKKLLLFRNESRQLRSPDIEGCRRSTSEPSVFRADKTICEIGACIFPREKRFLYGRLVLALNIACFEQARDDFNDPIFRHAVPAA